MKTLYVLIGLLIISSFSMSYANDIELKKYEDILLLEGGTAVKGAIVKFGSNSFKVESADGKITKIKNDKVIVVAVAQDMTSEEKFLLGKLDGKRFAKNKGGNFAFGFLGVFTGVGILAVPTVVYLTSDQSPNVAAQYGPNKTIVDDKDYLEGFSKGARSKSLTQSLIGVASGVGSVFLIVRAIFGAMG